MSIQIRDLTYVYSENLPYETVALDHINMEIRDHSFNGIIGHTGSGKSTLIQHLNGLLKPKSGQIIVDGIDITGSDVKLREIRKMIGLVFQYPEYQLFEETVQKDVAFGPLNLGLSQENVEARVREALTLVGLDFSELADRSPFELSGGQKRRVAIAGVIAMKPKVLVLDEPTAGLDPRSHRDILQLIRNVHEQEKNTIVLVSHNMGDIAALSDQVFVMEKGKLILSGTPREVFANTALLKGIGLGLPPAAELMEQVRQRCADAPRDVLTVEEAEQQIVRWFGKYKKC
jgi:energy-coupling factor transport system ATP-binding protein